MNKTGVIIQTRMGSSRLPGKVLKDIGGKSVLAHVIERIKSSQLIDTIIIATTNKPIDDVIEKEALINKVEVFRGSESDVLSRYFGAAQKFNLSTIVRITSDCPLIDTRVLDGMIEEYHSNRDVFVTNSGPDCSKRTYPRGLDIEIFSFEMIRFAFENANKEYHREHVTPYLYEGYFKVINYLNNNDYSMHRWTLDTVEDLLFIREVYNHFYHGKHDFFMEDILNFVLDNPAIYSINKHIKQKKVSLE